MVDAVPLDASALRGVEHKIDLVDILIIIATLSFSFGVGLYVSISKRRENQAEGSGGETVADYYLTKNSSPWYLIG